MKNNEDEVRQEYLFHAKGPGMKGQAPEQSEK
jgi:hypothetical protein